ncbi:MAG TPA: twin-arginine translocation signal domain-containing protein [Thermodesulfobacteriota bacterium]|nr:twin-arginine translocation signal domain-containing protein [Thermodesulfobacteriota bacterium]
MGKEMNRRDFIKASAAAGTVLLTGDLLKPSAWGQGVFKIPECEKIVITVITDNLADATLPDYKIARRLPRIASPLDSAAHGEHGLSYQIETVVNGQSHSCLFDFASDPQGVMKNMNLLKMDLGKIEALALSHDHWDHQAAFLEILKNKKESFRKGIPFYVGEQFFVGTYGRRPDGTVQTLMALKKEDVEALGLVKIVEVKEPTAIIPGAYLPGKIEQVTEYEKVPPNFVAKRGNEYVQETFPGEQAVVLNAKGKGLVVLSGCAHRGIVNAVKQAQRMTGIEKVHAIIGGFHLTGAKSELVEKTIADIKAIGPDYIVPTHCTGFAAITAFAKAMPDQFILNSAGTRYIIGI